jgi:hypothetical protein
MNEAQTSGVADEWFSKANVDALDRIMKGAVLHPSDDGYDEL